MGKSQDKKKYRHFLKRIFINNFLGSVAENIETLKAKNVIDVGCGEGYSDALLLKKLPCLEIIGIDINEQYLKQAKKNNPKIKYLKKDIFNLDFHTNAFDLAIVLEVLEHLKNPGQAIKQVKKISHKAIFSVPHEPWFSLISLLSGNYMKTFGRHPEHINGWNQKTFKQLLCKDYNEVNIKLSFPWIIAVCQN